MPELPEVETVCRGLQQALAGARIESVALRRANLRFDFPHGFAEMLAGKTIKSISRRAKYLLFELSGNITLVAHLGMSGRFSVEAKTPKKYAAHDHVIITLNDGRTLIYNDPRRFGIMDIAITKKREEHKLLAHLGPEPFARNFDSAYLKQALLARKAAIKVALMDQELVVGVGNIYASEALFLAKIDPRTPAHEAPPKAALLIRCIRKVLAAAIESGGSSLRDFLHVSGEAGYFQHQFNVYDREAEPCVVCGTPIASIRQAGRSTFYCRRCQQ